MWCNYIGNVLWDRNVENFQGINSTYLFNTVFDFCPQTYTLYLPHMEYEGSIGFVMIKMNIFIADFHVLGLFMTKKHDLSDKKKSVCHAPLLLLYAKFVPRLQPRP
jgi:hypothetical protein